MAVRFGLRESDTHLTVSSIAQSQHPARFKASRDFARSSSKRVVGDGAPHTYYTYVQFVFMYVLACVRNRRRGMGYGKLISLKCFVLC